jgi:hypothetical protein
MVLRESTLGMGIGAGFCALVTVFFVQLEYAGPFMRTLLIVFGAAGAACTVIEYRRTQARLARYERALRQQGIDPDCV